VDIRIGKVWSDFVIEFPHKLVVSAHEGIPLCRCLGSAKTHSGANSYFFRGVSEAAPNDLQLSH